MGIEELRGDNRHFTGVVQGRRIGESQPVLVEPSIFDIYRKTSSNRKHLRLRREEDSRILRFAQFADSIQGLTFQEKRALLVTEADIMVENGTFRVSRILGMGTEAITAARQIIESGEKEELFGRVRELMTESEEAR